jgi:hypothetical protein
MIGDGTACHFGQWLHANQGFLPLPEQFEYIQSLHASFHLAAAKLAVAVKGNKKPPELKRQMEVLQGFSNQLIAALSEVKASLFPLRRSVSPMPGDEVGVQRKIPCPRDVLQIVAMPCELSEIFPITLCVSAVHGNTQPRRM